MKRTCLRYSKSGERVCPDPGTPERGSPPGHGFRTGCSSFSVVLPAGGGGEPRGRCGPRVRAGHSAAVSGALVSGAAVSASSRTGASTAAPGAASAVGRAGAAAPAATREAS